MFVQYERTAQGWQHVGTSHSEHEDSSVINIPVSVEDYVAWIENPSLFRRYEVHGNATSGYRLELMSEKTKLPDMELVPWPDDQEEDPPCDVVMVITDQTVLVHMFNEKMANDPNFTVQYYATEADNHMNPLWDIQVVDVDSVFTELPFDPKNIRVVVREPLEGVVYGLKIT